MKDFYLYLTFFIFFIYPNSDGANAQFVKNGQFVIRGNGNDYGSTLELLDNNYLYLGTTSAYGSGGQDILVVKFAPHFSYLSSENRLLFIY
jgi:hypothetical protein